MNKEIERVLLEFEKRKWITINKNLRKDVLASMFFHALFKEMTVESFISTMTPKEEI